MPRFLHKQYYLQRRLEISDGSGHCRVLRSSHGRRHYPLRSRAQGRRVRERFKDRRKQLGVFRYARDVNADQRRLFNPFASQAISPTGLRHVFCASYLSRMRHVFCASYLSRMRHVFCASYLNRINIAKSQHNTLSVSRRHCRIVRLNPRIVCYAIDQGLNQSFKRSKRQSESEDTHQRSQVYHQTSQ